MIQTLFVYIASIFIGYLFGCFNLAYLISKYKKMDLQNIGSKNLGASNTFISIGKGLGVLVAICDILKCTVAILLVGMLFPNYAHLTYLTGIACVIGHMFPFYLKFKGGKGFASFLGMTLALHWKYFIIIGICTILITLLTKYIVLATMTTVISYPVFLFFQTGSLLIVTLVSAVSIIIIIKHRKNLIRIIKKEEFQFKM